MKKIISVILTISFVFLIGCSSNITTPTTKHESLGDSKKPTGFVEMNIDEDYLQNAQSICSKDDLVIFMSSVTKDKDGNIVHPKGEEDYENTTDTPYIVEYNAKDNKLIDVFEIKDCPITEIWGIELENDNIVIFSNSEKKNAYYDLDMNFIEETDREIVDELETAKKSSFYTEMSAARDGYCDFTGTNNTQYLFFYDNPEELYIFNAEKNYQPQNINDENGYIFNEAFGNSGEVADFSVIDYKNANEINKASISAKDYGYEYTSTNQTGFGNEFAVCVEYFGNNDNEDYTFKIFCWNYQNEPTNNSLDIKKTSDIDSLNEQCISEIKSKYNVDIHINEECDNTKDYVKCNGDINSLVLYNDISAIKSFLNSLPEGMITEAYSGFADKEFERAGIRLDIVSEITMQNDITDDVSAFAQRWSEPMELCFAYNTVTMNNIAHEFMHLFDHRIDDYLNTKDTSLFNDWAKLNDDFSHEYDEKEEFHRNYNFDENQFISEYASSNDEEDRAVIFEYLYTSHGDESKPWLEYEGVKTKTDYLIKLMRETFPSVQKVQTAYWEE